MTRGANGAATKEAIRQAAITEFRLHGYRSASLEGIASGLGITRAAVLHHYDTKADLLDAVLDPYLTAVEAALGRCDPAGTLTPRQRRGLLGDITDVFVAHHDVAGILIRDISSHTDPATVIRMTAITETITVLMTRPCPTPIDRVIVGAILGAILRPLTDPGLDPADPRTRAVLTTIAATIARQIEPSRAVRPKGDLELVDAGR